MKAPAGMVPTASDLAAIDDDPVRCFDRTTSAAMVAEVETAQKDGDTLGGVVEVVVWGLPPGLGSHVHWDRRLDAQLAGALMGIQAIKGVEVGDGFELARSRGSAAHDEIVPGDHGIARASHRSGGTEGGMSTGEVLRVRAAMKPISTVPRALRTVDVATGEAAVAHHQRSDVCAVPAAGVVAEAMVALVLANAALEKFGGDSVAETRRNCESYLKQVADRGLQVRPNHEHRSEPCAVERPIVLVGAPGSGKSTVGALLAERLGVAFRDVDAVIVGADRKVDRRDLHRRRGGGIPRPRGADHRRTAATHRRLVARRRRGVVRQRPGRLFVVIEWCGCRVGLAQAVKRVGLDTARPLLLGNVRGQLLKLLNERAAALWRGGHRCRSTPTAQLRPRSSK